MTEVSLIPTVVPSTLKDIDDTQRLFGEFASSIHIDFADGLFTTNLTWMPHKNEMLPAHETVSYEAHLMTHDPTQVGSAFVRAGARRIIAHVEAFPNPSRARHAMKEWKELGAKEVGIAILIDTPIPEIDPYIDFCDEVLMMTIAVIGRQGASFDERGIGRVSELRARHPLTPIAVDGGIDEISIKQLGRAGATRFCVGRALSVGDRRAEVYVRLKALAQSAIQ